MDSEAGQPHVARTPRVPPLAVVGIAAGLMWAAARWLPGAVHVPGEAALAVGLALGGIAVCALGVTAFRRARTTVDPRHPGRASQLVIAGIYRYTRNPMYLGFALLLAGWGAWLGNLCALLVVPAFALYLSRFQIAAEEQALQDRFGQPYRDYMGRVRRWL